MAIDLLAVLRLFFVSSGSFVALSSLSFKSFDFLAVAGRRFRVWGMSVSSVASFSPTTILVDTVLLDWNVRCMDVNAVEADR